MNVEDKEIAEEVSEIFQEFVAFKKAINENYKEESFKKYNRMNIWFNLICIFSALSYVFLGQYYFPVLFKEYGYVLSWILVALIVGTAFFMLFIWSDIRELKDFLEDAPLHFLKAYPEIGKVEIEFLQKLDGYSSQALEFVRLRFDQANDDQGMVVNLLIGSLTKIGIFPAFLALVFALYKVPEASNSFLVMVLTFMVMGIYFVCFKVSSAGIRFKRCSFLIGFYLEHLRKVE